MRPASELKAAHANYGNPMGTGIGSLKWPKCSALCGLSDEMSSPIQYRSWTALSDYSELQLSALKTRHVHFAKYFHASILIRA